VSVDETQVGREGGREEGEGGREGELSSLSLFKADDLLELQWRVGEAVSVDETQVGREGGREGWF